MVKLSIYLNRRVFVMVTFGNKDYKLSVRTDKPQQDTSYNKEKRGNFGCWVD